MGSSPVRFTTVVGSMPQWPPSMIRSREISFSEVTTIVCGAAPQSKVMAVAPVFAMAASKAASVQLPGVPSPTTCAPLMLATAGKHTALIEYLVKQGANPDLTNGAVGTNVEAVLVEQRYRVRFDSTI